MIYTIQAPLNVIKASVQLPSSKSISNRALIINSLCNANIPLNNLSNCDDTCIMQKALNSNDSLIDIGAAGTAMRFLTAYLANRPGCHTITGTERMQNRPIQILVDALSLLGADIQYIGKKGYPPLKINGKELKGGEITLDGSISSQYISALLMIAPTLEQGLTLHLSGNIVSRPYIHLTLSLMKEFGIESEWKDNLIKIQPQTYQIQSFTVESDWSSASYWYQIAALSKDAEIELLGLNKNSYQGDSFLTELFYQLGISTHYTDKGVILKKGYDRCRRLIYNFVNQPDLVQTMAVTSVLMNIPFRFAGLQSLRIKETDRIEALKQELKKLGYIITEFGDNLLEWNGETCNPESSPLIETYEDHRMALAFAPAAISLGTININNPKVVSKSYPHYWDDLVKNGFSIQEFTK